MTNPSAPLTVEEIDAAIQAFENWVDPDLVEWWDAEDHP